MGALQTSTIQRGYLPFGQNYFVRLPYGVNQTITCGAGSTTTAAGVLFRMNSLHDPDYTNAGHQPYQWDQLSPMYNIYTVYGLKYELTFFDPTEDGCVCGVGFYTDANTGDTPIGKEIDVLHERKLCQTVPLSNTGSQRYTFSGYIPINEMWGLTKEQLMANVYFQASPGANPGSVAYMAPFALNPRAVTTTLQVTGRLTYYARLSQYLGPATS